MERKAIPETAFQRVGIVVGYSYRETVKPGGLG